VSHEASPSEVAARMWADDRASHAAGFALGEVAIGLAHVSLTVSAHQVNGHGICHGGVIFMLADSAMAIATNAGNEAAVAAGANIEFLAPANLGDQLVAVAGVSWTQGRSAITDVVVKRPTDGTVIAHFRGRTRQLGRPVIA
jgi:phenylacetic acid degradation protein PaaD